MQFDQRIGDGEAEARTLHAVGHDDVALLERPSEPRDVLGGDARPVVLDVEIDLLADDLRADFDRAALGREFHRVAHQRREDPFDRGRVRLDGQVRVDVDRDRDAFLARRGRDVLHRAADRLLGAEPA